MTTAAAIEMLQEKMKERGLNPENPKKFNEAIKKLSSKEYLILEKLDKLEGTTDIMMLKINIIELKLIELIEILKNKEG